MKISGICDRFFSSKLVKNTIKMASDNPVLFSSTATLALSGIVRPAVILAAPQKDKEDKKYAVTKSITSCVAGYAFAYTVSKPVETAIKRMDWTPQKYLKPETIANFKGEAKKITESEKYLFATRFFKTGVGVLTAIPKSLLTCALIPVVTSGLKHKKQKSKNEVEGEQKPSFAGANKLAQGLGKIMDSKFMQKFSDKFMDTNLVQAMSAVTDILMMGSFTNSVRKSKQIPEENKKPLIFNSLFSTSMSIVTSVALNKYTDKKMDKFVDYFLNLNKDIKNAQVCAQGIKTSKTVFVMGGVHYIVMPFLSTMLSGVVKNFGTAKEKQV